MRRKRTIPCAVLLAAVTPSAAFALPAVCIAELPNQWARELHVAVGCELIDCCPGCPGGAPLDWLVRVEGAGIAEVDVRIEGHASASEPVRALPGETRIAAVTVSGGETAPLASLRIVPDEAALARLHEEARAADGDPVASASLTIEQLVADRVVNLTRFEWPVVDCTLVATTPCDEIAQQDNAKADASVLVIDARRAAGAAGCRSDRVRRGALSTQFPNWLANAGCRSEVAVFSEGDAALLREEVTSWTDACGDRLDVKLEPPTLQAPATFYLAVPDWVAWLQWGAPVDDVAHEDLANANQIYEQNKTGVSFAAASRILTSQQIEIVLQAMPAAIVSSLLNGVSPASLDCALPSQLQALGLYQPNQLNVYYLPVPGTGMTCADDRNIVFVALDRKPETLAHEFGHALSLIGTWGHTNGVPGLDATNLMWVDEPDPRSHVSLGQAFRMNFETHSVLNLNHVRTGPTRACPAEPPPHPDPGACPKLMLDWARP